MQTRMKIMPYSCYDNWSIADKGDNHSRIVTKMIQLAGRYCEHYASDIIYDADAFIEAIKNKENFERYLFFREMGVSGFSKEHIECIGNTSFIQCWHLTYDAETEQQLLERVTVYFERTW